MCKAKSRSGLPLPLNVIVVSTQSQLDFDLDKGLPWVLCLGLGGLDLGPGLDYTDFAGATSYCTELDTVLLQCMYYGQKDRSYLLKQIVSRIFF